MYQGNGFGGREESEGWGRNASKTGGRERKIFVGRREWLGWENQGGEHYVILDKRGKEGGGKKGKVGSGEERKG